MTNLLEKTGIILIKNELLGSNAYVVPYEGNLAFVVDPPMSCDCTEQIFERLSVIPTHVFCTHGHFDHVGGVANLVKKYGAISVLHKADIQTAKSANFLMMAYGIQDRIETPHFTNPVTGGEIFKLGESELRIEHVPGHSKGSCFLFWGKILFSGDSLYSDGIGLPSPGEDLDILRKSLLKWWTHLDDDIIVCPGHGDANILGEIRIKNVKLLEFLEGKN